jgi:hypothetical protein
MKSFVYIMAVNNTAKHQGVEGRCELIRVEYLYAWDAHERDAHIVVWMHEANDLRTFLSFIM